MRLTCPSCAAEYEIDSGAIGKRGRTVRCASCAADWFQPPAVASVAEAAAAVEAATANAARERERRREAGGGRPRETIISPDARRESATPEQRPAIEGGPAQAIAHDREAQVGPPVTRRRAMEPDEFALSLRADEDAERGLRAGGAFLAGFATVALLALLLIAVYVKRAEIADLVPAARATLAVYADLVDQARAALSRLIDR